MIVDGTDFNVDYWSRFTSFEEFLNETKQVYENQNNRDQRLKVAYELICIQGQTQGIGYNGRDQAVNRADR